MLWNIVATLLYDEKGAGEYEVDFKGNALISGAYFYRLQSGSFVQTRRIILLK